MNWPPWLVFLLVTALSISFFYQLISRRYGWRVLAYWIFFFVLLMAGEAGAESVGWDVTRVGDLRMAPDLAAAFAGMSLLWFLGI